MSEASLASDSKETRAPVSDDEEDDAGEDNTADEEDTDEDNDDEGDEESHVVLGFADPPEYRVEMRRQYFPSKVGGKPAWLNPRDLPTQQQLQCGSCSQPLKFLLQLYVSEWEDINPNAYHRTLYVFLCRTAECLGKSGSVKVFRSQLPMRNPFYKHDKPPQVTAKDQAANKREDWEDEPWAEGGVPVKLCFVCGLPASSGCGRCQRVRYCSREHQTKHWKTGHKADCGAAAAGSGPSVADWRKTQEAFSSEVFPELEIWQEDEEIDSDQDFVREQRLHVEYKQEQSTLSAKEIEEEDQSFKGRWDTGKRNDPVMVAFQTRCSFNPKQIIRYDLGENPQPLWACSGGRIEGKVPDCPHCTSPRKFEFQIMPQLLDSLDLTQVDAGDLEAAGTRAAQLAKLKEALDKQPDWGTIVVYTCSASCGAGVPTPAGPDDGPGPAAPVGTGSSGSAYRQEFVYLQPWDNEADAAGSAEGPIAEEEDVSEPEAESESTATGRSAAKRKQLQEKLHASRVAGVNAAAERLRISESAPKVESKDSAGKSSSKKKKKSKGKGAESNGPGGAADKKASQ